MNPKTKSILFFATFVITLIIYSNVDQKDKVLQNELAENTIENVSSQETALN